jgi:hypothetical protein
MINFATSFRIILVKNKLKKLTFMKRLRVIVLAAFAVVSMAASAQEPFGTLYLQYNPCEVKADNDNHSSLRFSTAFSFGYNYSTPLFSIPLYLEFGAGAQWFYKSEDNVRNSLFSFKVPINLMFSIDVSDAFSIQPYGGFYGRYNAIGKTKITQRDYEAEKDYEYTEDWFSYYDYKRFQFGWNAGCKFRICETVAIGAGYFMDLTKLGDHTHMEGFDLTLGYTF